MSAATAQQAARIVIDYPEEGSIFPPDFAAPTFLWRDTQAAASWEVEIAFANHLWWIENRPEIRFLKDAD